MSICNLFKEIGDDRSKFYTFSEYTNDLAGAVNNDGLSNIRPSGFICLNLNISTEDKLYTLNDILLNYYENLQCCERDASRDDNSYKRYLLGGLFVKLAEFLDTEEYKFCKRNIDIVGDSVIDGIKYDDIVCYLDPISKPDNTILFDIDNYRTFSNNSTYLRGYEGVSEAGDVATNNAWTGEDDFYATTIENIDYTGGDSFSFNSILVLYDYNDEIKDIPLGLYITKDSITKYISNDEIYNQGTSYALRIGMRFACTVDSASPSVHLEDVTADYTTAEQLVDRMNTCIDKMNVMTSKFNEYYNIVKNNINAYIETLDKLKWKEIDNK